MSDEWMEGAFVKLLNLYGVYVYYLPFPLFPFKFVCKILLFFILLRVLRKNIQPMDVNVDERKKIIYSKRKNIIFVRVRGE
jgi:hypothetical protein